jgi:hypothetical protein
MDGQVVRLKYAESVTFSPGGGVTGVMDSHFDVKVKNIAVEKDIAIRYAQPNGVFTEKAMTFPPQNHFGDYDVFTLTDDTFSTTQFVVRYTVAGQTFWDNNQGADYRIDDVHPNTVGGNVVLNKAVAHRGSEAGGGFVFTTSRVDGEILVKNLSFNKRVGIRLSPNNWGTFEDTIATFSGPVSVAVGVSEVEVWKFITAELNLDQSSPVFRFAIFNNNLDTGEFFWDNNFGQDYTLSKNDLSTVS